MPMAECPLRHAVSLPDTHACVKSVQIPGQKSWPNRRVAGQQAESVSRSKFRCAKCYKSLPPVPAPSWVLLSPWYHVVGVPLLLVTLHCVVLAYVG
jgi:hypothetical protein